MSIGKLLVYPGAGGRSHGRARPPAAGRAGAAPSGRGMARVLGERLGRRGTEQNELFRLEFGQNSCKMQEFSLENSKSLEINFQHFRKYRRNSDKFSSNSVQKSMKRIQK